MNVPQMLKEAMNQAGHTPKSMAVKWGFSQNAVYAAMSGERDIPSQAMPKISKMSLLGGLSVALKVTQYSRIFDYFRVDRHIQNLLQLSIKEDSEADEAINKLPRLLINKSSADDLNKEEKQQVELAAKEVVDRIAIDLNFLIELETKFGINVLAELTGKVKTAH